MKELPTAAPHQIAALTVPFPESSPSDLHSVGIKIDRTRSGAFCGGTCTLIGYARV
ncbi:MAG: hypothetical protein GX929_02115 [Clostridiales bacterium]|nr:hypothetical protein [Clostridiales bacterium]